ncbi:MAG TPA: SURF1 family protein [Gammaproteobacteria bacterium]|nr:SURF1 family protein [Gammaproteobacteria bacterium]
MTSFPETHWFRNFLRDYHFKPRWSLTLATVVLLALFILLGCWQLRRAAEKNQLTQLYQSRAQAAPLPLHQLPTNTDLRYYPIIVSGYYDNAHSILLDNKIHEHRVGYEVITPMIVANEKKAVLINRGWIPGGQDRRQLPVLTSVPGPQTVRGVIYISPGKPFTLGKSIETVGQWPLRLQNLDFPAITNALHQPVYPWVVLLNADENNGFVRNWQAISSPAQKHVGYAVQWFTFAGVLIIIFVALNFRKTK